MLSRHPELARKMKANSAGERVLDEEAMMTARAILRKEKIEDRRKRSAVGAPTWGSSSPMPLHTT